MAEYQLTPPPSPSDIMLSHITGAGVCQLVGVAARLGIAEQLTDQPRSATEIARACNTLPRFTYRFLRGLSYLGILREHEDQQFSLTFVGTCLLQEVRGSLNAFARMYSEPWMNTALTHLYDTLKTGESGFRKAFGMGLFEWLAENPEELNTFDEAMSSFTGLEVDLILEAYDFSEASRIVDVGGGHGALIIRILKQYADISATLFDRPEVTCRAKSDLQRAGLISRCDVVSGDFFDVIPTGGDLYLLKHILHDWDDPRARRILENVASAMRPGGRLLVFEQGITSVDTPDPGKLMDIYMMALTEGGKERSSDEFCQLFEEVGITYSRTIPTMGPLMITEGIRAGSSAT